MTTTKPNFLTSFFIRSMPNYFWLTGTPIPRGNFVEHAVREGASSRRCGNLTCEEEARDSRVTPGGPARVGTTLMARRPTTPWDARRTAGRQNDPTIELSNVSVKRLPPSVLL